MQELKKLFTDCEWNLIKHISKKGKTSDWFTLATEFDIKV